MEYKLYILLHKNKNISKNLLLRSILSKLLAFIWVLVILFPAPFSVPVWSFLIIISIILWVSKASKLKYIIKIRKSIIFLAINIFNKKIVKRKIYDIKKLFKKINT